MSLMIILKIGETRLLTGLRAFIVLFFCYKQNYIEKDFSNEIKARRALSKATLPITRDEIFALLKCISLSEDKYRLRDKTLFSIYAYTGLRKMEVISLKISNYDKISKIFQLISAKGILKRMQTIPDVLINILNQYIDAISFTSESLFLFPGSDKTSHISARQVSNIFNKWKKVARIRNNLTIHSFRAGFATELYKYSNDPLLVSTALGHSSFNTTIRYISEDLIKLNSAINKVFNS